MNKQLKTGIIIYVSFIIHYFLLKNFKLLKPWLDQYTQQGLVSYIIAYVLIGTPLFIGAYFVNRNSSIFQSLGLKSNILKGFLFSLLFTLPLFIGGLIFYKPNPEIEVQDMIAGTLIAGLMEELYYRGFLYGLLFKYTKLGFIPSILVGAILFAIGHLYQSQNLGEMIGIFLITFLGAVFFAWLYTEWKFNLWIPIFTHTFMNLAWYVFNIDESALGSLTANILRGLTIAIAILFTFYTKKKQHDKLAIYKATLWMKQ